MGREEQLGFEVICNWNNGYPSILEVLRPIKKIKGQWVEVKGKNGIRWVETNKIKRIKNG